MTVSTALLEAGLFLACLVATVVLTALGEKVPREITTSMVGFGGAVIGSALPTNIKLGGTP